MKLVTYGMDGMLKLGAVHEGRVADLAALAGDRENARRFHCTRCFLAGGEDTIAAARSLISAAVATGASGSWPALADVKLKAPVPDPRKILCMVGNYPELYRRTGIQLIPKEQQPPRIFMKPPTCVIGPGGAILQPGPVCTCVDWEAELGVVIGKDCHYVRAEEALDYVAGYVNFNDVSGRPLTHEATPEMAPNTETFNRICGKWFDTFGPMGPFLVLKDEVPDPQVLDIELRVNGEVKQKANTSEMTYSVAELIEWISQFTTLEPGDIISTGTPAGIAYPTGPFLQVGDVVEMEITGLGVLRNTVAPAVVPVAKQGAR